MGQKVFTRRHMGYVQPGMPNGTHLVKAAHSLAKVTNLSPLPAELKIHEQRTEARLKCEKANAMPQRRH